jgi:DNA invertase Pin-like site-specific DNA recombinase
VVTTADAPRRQRRRSTTANGLVAYLRVSTDEQAQSGLGLDAQRATIIGHVARSGHELVDTFVDAISGRTMDRPGLAAALAEIEAGRARGLIVAKLDRLSRSLLDFAGLMERSRREGWSLIALDLGVDTCTPQGELMATVLASFAQFERRLIGERTKSALAVKRSQGATLGRPREMADEAIERICELRDAGLTFAAVAERLTEEGIATPRGGKWTAQGVHRALRSWESACRTCR